MKALLPILLSTILSLYLKEDLGELFLSQGEFYTLDLSDYFVGNNLTYSITDSNSENKEISIHNKPRFELLAFLPFSGKCGSAIYSHPGIITTYSRETNKHYIYGYHQSCLEIYYFESDAEKISSFWYGEIETEFANTTIVNVSFVAQWISMRDILIIQVRQQEISENSQVWRNDFLVMGVSRNMQDSRCKNLNLSEITYASKIIYQIHYSGQLLIVYGEFPDGNNALFLYIFENNSWKVHQIITKVFNDSGSQKISISNFFFLMSNIFYVHETNFGIIVYKRIGNNYWIQNNVVDLNGHGDLQFTALSKSGSDKNIVFICMNSSLIVASSNLRELSFAQSPLSDIFHQKSIQIIDSVHNFYFIQSKSLFENKPGEGENYKNRYTLSIIQDKTALEGSVDYDLIEEIGDKFYENGLWKIIEKEYCNYLFYLRLDQDGLRVYKVFYKANLEIWGDSNSFAKITASEKNSTVSSILNVVSIPKNSESIYRLNNYRPYTVKPIDLFFSRPKYFVMLDLDEYFSAPNLNFSIDLPDLDFAKFEINSPILKVSFEKRTQIENEVLKVEVDNDFIYYYFNDHIEIYTNTTVLFLSLEIENPIKVCFSAHALVIYWRSKEGKFMLSMYERSSLENKTFNEATDIECKFLFTIIGYIVCADNSQIDVYLSSNLAPCNFFSLKGTDFLDGKAWNLIDISHHNYKYFETGFLWLLDASQELFAINLHTISQKKDNKLIVRWKSPIEAFKVEASDRYIYLFKKDGSFNAYSYQFTLSRCFVASSGQTLIQTWNEEDVIFIQLDNQFLAYDTSKSAHNNPIFSIKAEKNAFISVENIRASSKICIFYPNKKYVEIYKQHTCHAADAFWTSKIACSMQNEFSISINKPEKLKENSYSSLLKVHSFNDKFSDSIEIPLNLMIYGAFISFKNNENWRIDKIREFNESWEISLQEFFIGQNISFYLRVNGADITENSNNFFPAEIIPKMEKIGEFSSKNKKFFGQALIKDINSIVISAGKELILINSTGFQNIPILVDLFSVTQLKNISCQPIDIFEHTKGSLVLIFTVCTYDIDQKLEGPNINRTYPLQLSVLALFEMNFNSGAIINFKLIKLPDDFNYLKSVTLNETAFEVILANIPKIVFENSRLGNVYRFSGIWDTSSIELKQIEVVNALTLGVESFYPSSIHAKLDNSNTIYYYISDYQNGIFILKAESSANSVLLREVKDQNLLGSIEICGDKLYALSHGASMSSYLIKDYINFELEWKNLWIYKNNFMEVSLGKELVCSPDGRFIAFLYHNDLFSQMIKIIDTKLEFSSKIYAEMNTFIENDYFSSKTIKFINTNTVSVISESLGAFFSYQINPSILKIREMNETEFFNLTYQWETDEFKIVVIGDNGYHTVSSDPLKLKIKGPKEKQLEAAWYEHWWFWMIIAIAIILIFLMVLYFIKYFMSKRKKVPINRPIMMSFVYPHFLE